MDAHEIVVSNCAIAQNSAGVSVRILAVAAALFSQLGEIVKVIRDPQHDGLASTVLDPR